MNTFKITIVFFRLSALGYICYLPDIHRVMIRTKSEYVSNTVTSISPQYVSFIVILSLTITLISKVSSTLL